MAITMAGVAVLRCGGHGVDRFVLNLNMAIGALDLVIGDVSPMHELGFAVAAQPRRIVMTSVAALARNLARSLYDVGMARRALHVEALYVAVVEAQIRFCDYLIRDFVTERAARRSLIELLPFEVAEETARFSYGDVAALHYLRVTGSATQFLFAPHLA